MSARLSAWIVCLATPSWFISVTIGCSPEKPEQTSSSAETQSGGTASVPVNSDTIHVPTASGRLKPETPIPGPEQDRTSPQSNSAGERILAEMANAYRNAAGYADDGIIELTFDQQVQQRRDTASFSVAFSRPDKLRVSAYQANILGDGERLYTTIAELDGQVLVVPIDERISLEEIYTDDIAGSVLSSGIGGRPPQLELLLGDDPLHSLLEGAEKVSLMGKREIEGQACVGIQLWRSGGATVFWVDERSYLLRQLDYPVPAESPIDALTAHFHNARFNPQLSASAFEFFVPEQAHLVRYLVPKPLPLPERLGDSVGQFRFVRNDGSDVTDESLRGKIVVIEFWFTGCPPCAERMPRLQVVYDQYHVQQNVEFLLVSVDDPQLSNSILEEKLSEWNVTMPWARDTEAFALREFQCEGYPHLVLLGPQGQIQARDSSYGRDLIAELPELLDRLSRGEDLAAAALAAHRHQLEAFRSALQVASCESGDSEVPVANIHERTDPKNSTWKLNWSYTDFSSPGNILAVSDTGQGPRYFVVDGARTIVELDAAGRLVDRYDLDLVEGELVAFLRTAVDGAGRRFFAVAASGQKSVHVFDKNWQRVCRYPSVDSSHAGISDVKLADVNQDGALEIVVGYWGDVGVQLASLAGERIWFNRSLQNAAQVLALADSANSRTLLWCSHDRGSLVQLDKDGENVGEVTVTGRFIYTLFGPARPDDHDPIIVGFSLGQQGETTIVGFRSDSTEVWSYPMPIGVHQNPIEPAASGYLFDSETPQRVLAGADGSLHVLAEDGKPIDSFYYGSELRGLAIAKTLGSAVLCVSTPDGVEAWTVRKSLD